jgi:hypothetical protein
MIPGHVTIVVALICATACGGTPAATPTSVNPPPAPGPAPTGQVFGFTSENGDWVGAGKTRRFDTAADFFSATAFCGNNRVEILVHAADGMQWNLSFAASRGTPLRVASFEGAGTSLASPLLAIRGEARSCNGATGRFDVLEALFGAGGRVERFHASFEQRCTGSTAKMVGEILLIAPVPYNLASGCF